MKLANPNIFTNTFNTVIIELNVLPYYLIKTYYIQVY